jgi:hypothetical protein
VRALITEIVVDIDEAAGEIVLVKKATVTFE